jgi:hypothetical protein
MPDLFALPSRQLVLRDYQLAAEPSDVEFDGLVD